MKLYTQITVLLQCLTVEGFGGRAYVFCTKGLIFKPWRLKVFPVAGVGKSSASGLRIVALEVRSFALRSGGSLSGQG